MANGYFWALHVKGEEENYVVPPPSLVEKCFKLSEDETYPLKEIEQRIPVINTLKDSDAVREIFRYGDARGRRAWL